MSDSVPVDVPVAGEDPLLGLIYPWLKSIEPYAPDAPNDADEAIQTELVSVEFFANLIVCFAIDRGDRFELVQRPQVPQGVTVDDLYERAVNNLATQVSFRIAETSYGGHGLIGDGNFEASTLCFGNIWQYCAEHLSDDLLICAPARDIVFFCPTSDVEQAARMCAAARDIYEHGNWTLSDAVLGFERGIGKLTDLRRTIYD